MRSSPNPSAGQGLSDATQSVFASGLGPESIGLPPVAGELLALGVDDVTRSVGDEALVREHLLGAGDLGPKPRPLRVDVAVRLRPLGLDHDLEDPLLLVLERDEDTAAPEGHRRLLDAL